ncbi:MAG: hypothetical protein WC637_06315 [Victivallales bacterium]|jgi:hypothetical protein
MIKHSLAALFFLACLWTVNAAETVRVPVNTVLWEKPDIKTVPLIFLTQNQELKAEEIKTVRSQWGSVCYRNITFYRVRIDNRDLWLAPGWQLNNGKVIEVCPTRSTYPFVSIILICFAVLSVLLYFRLKGYYARTDYRLLESFLLIVPLILFHYAWFVYFRSVFHDAYHLPTDENEYFRIADCLMQWDFSKPFSYTIGYPLFCIPFLWLNGGDNPVETSRIISYFSAIVMMPASIALGFILIKKLCGSAWKAFIATALYLVIPKLFMAMEIPYTAMMLSPLGIWHSSYIFCAYQFCLTGFNSLSEWVSVNLFFSIAIAALYWRGNKTKYFTLGLLFGLALLVRMNNLMFAPLLAYLFWLNDREKLSDWRYMAKAICIAVLAAGGVFACQLLVNHIQLGSIFKTPYDIRGEYQGGRLGFQYFANISRYYCKIENLYFAAALPGIFLIRNTVLRNALALWILPTLLFFFCFNFTGFPYRFFLPVFPALVAGLVCSDVWSAKSSKVKKCLLAGIMLFLTIPVLPFSFTLTDLDKLAAYNCWEPISLICKFRLYLALPIWLLGLFCFRKDGTLCLYMLFFSVMIYEGSYWLMITSMLGLILYTLIEWGRELIIANRKPE